MVLCRTRRYSSNFRKWKRLRAFKLIGRELKGLQRKSKVLEGLGKGPRGTSILDPPQEGFQESENWKKNNSGLQSPLVVAHLKGCGPEERFLTLLLVCSSLYFLFNCATGGSCSSSSWISILPFLSQYPPLSSTALWHSSHIPSLSLDSPVALPRLWALKGKGHRGEERVRTERDGPEFWLEKHFLLLMPPWAWVPFRPPLSLPVHAKSSTAAKENPNRLSHLLSLGWHWPKIFCHGKCNYYLLSVVI